MGAPCGADYLLHHFSVRVGRYSLYGAVVSHWTDPFSLSQKVAILRLWDDHGAQFDPECDYRAYEQLRVSIAREMSSSGELLSHRERQRLAASGVTATPVAPGRRAGVDLDAFLGVTGKL
jgi:hypothetical protein